MLYLAQKPDGLLSRSIRLLWYVRAPQVEERRQRILPSGCAQIILNLSRDYLVDCHEHGRQELTSPSLIVGQRSIYEIIDASDLTDLIGIVFEPGCLPILAADRADVFSNSSVPLDGIWGASAHSLRDQLRELTSPQSRLHYLEQFLTAKLSFRLHSCRFQLHPAVAFALQRFQPSPSIATVSEVAKSTGWSHRRFSQIFREQVGFAPKAWCRLARFRRAVQQLHANRRIPWAEVAADCGFYDQSHFANEFRAFSGVDVTAYMSRNNHLWAHHMHEE